MSRPDGLLQPPAQIFEAKPQPRLLNHLPQHRLAAGRKALLQPIATRHEVVNSHIAAERLPNRQRVRNVARPLARIGVVKPALIGIDPPAMAEIVKVADGALAGARLDHLYIARGKAALDQAPVKPLEERAGERVHTVAALPRRAVQSLHRREPELRLGLGRRLPQLHRTVAREMTQRAMQLLTGVGAQHRVEIAVAVGQAAQFDAV